MNTVKSAATCRWAVQTLWLDSPLWLDGWAFPWSCVRDGDSRPIATTDECRTCARWQARGPVARPVPSQSKPAR